MRLIREAILQEVRNRTTPPTTGGSYLTVIPTDYLTPSANLGAWANNSAIRFRIRNMYAPGDWTTYGLVAGSTTYGIFLMFSNQNFKFFHGLDTTLNWTAAQGYDYTEFTTNNWIDCVYIMTTTAHYFFSEAQSRSNTSNVANRWQYFLGAPSSALGTGCDINLLSYYNLSGYSGPYTKAAILAMSPTNSWDFSDGSGNIITDKVGTINLTLTGTPNWKTE